MRTPRPCLAAITGISYSQFSFQQISTPPLVIVANTSSSPPRILTRAVLHCSKFSAIRMPWANRLVRRPKLRRRAKMNCTANPAHGTGGNLACGGESSAVQNVELVIGQMGFISGIGEIRTRLRVACRSYLLENFQKGGLRNHTCTRNLKRAANCDLQLRLFGPVSELNTSCFAIARRAVTGGNSRNGHPTSALKT
jgi:hypothetical protein